MRQLWKPFAVALAVSALFVPALAQTRETLQLLGNSQLDAPGVRSIAGDDLKVSPHPESDAELAGIRRGPGSAAVPYVSAPQTLRTGSPGVSLAFIAMSHRDQRTAGTGAYANTQFSTEPPDQALAVGNGYVLQAVNAAIAIYDAQTGAVRSGPTPLNQFFRLKPEVDRVSNAYGDFTSDPRALYDAQLQRWFVSVTAIATKPESGAFVAPTRLLMAVSQTADPTGEWKLYAIDTTFDGSEGCPCFGDQPALGSNADGLFITTNAFSLSEGYAGVQIYALSKQLLAEGASPAIVHFNSPKLTSGLAFSLQPAIPASVADSQNGTEYFSSVADIRNMLDQRLAIWALTNTASLTDAVPALRLRSTIVITEHFGVPPDAVQPPGDTRLGALTGEPAESISTNDHRMQQAVYSDGRLWSALTTMVSIKGDPTPRSAIAYFAVSPSATTRTVHADLVRQGYVAVSGTNLFYPAIAANGERATLAFSVAGPNNYLSAAFANVSEAGAGTVQIIAPGVAPLDGFSGYKYFGGTGAERTGDYSAATTDENGDIWIASEYVPGAPRTLLANWGTYIARIAKQE